MRRTTVAADGRSAGATSRSSSGAPLEERSRPRSRSTHEVHGLGRDPPVLCATAVYARAGVTSSGRAMSATVRGPPDPTEEREHRPGEAEPRRGALAHRAVPLGRQPTAEDELAH